MLVQTIHSKIHLLPEEHLRELLMFIEFLLTKNLPNDKTLPRRKPVFGSAKGVFKMADDFDAPLDDFKEYMP